MSEQNGSPWGNLRKLWKGLLRPFREACNLARKFPSSFRFQQQDRNVDGMPYVMGDAPIQKVGDESVTMRCHSNQVNLLLTRYPNDLIGRFTVSEDVLGFDSLTPQAFTEVCQIVTVTLHFFRLSKLKLVEIACYPSMRDAH
jgi:hypothetical protein